MNLEHLCVSNSGCVLLNSLSDECLSDSGCCPPVVYVSLWCVCVCVCWCVCMCVRVCHTCARNLGTALAAAGQYKEAVETLGLVRSEKYKASYGFVSWLARSYIMIEQPKKVCGWLVAVGCTCR